MKTCRKPVTKGLQVTATILVSSILLSTTVLAADKYISLAGGTFSPVSTTTFDSNLSTVTVNYDTGYAVGGTVGADFNGLRIENELIYRQANPDAWALGWLINAWYDVKNSSPLTPYLGGGCGLGRGHAASPGIIDNDIAGIAYQAGGGLTWQIQPNISIDLGYRYFGITDTSSNGSGTNDLAGSSFLLGGRFRF